MDNLRSEAKRVRDALLSTVSDDPEIDKGVLLATRKELEAGCAEGPVHIGKIPEGMPLSRVDLGCARVRRRMGRK